MNLSVLLLTDPQDPQTVEARRRVTAYLSLKKYPWEIQVCADLQEGVRRSSGRYLLLTRPELPTPIKEVDKLLAALEGGADIAVGSRLLRAKGCDVRQSLPGRLAAEWVNVWKRVPGLRDAHGAFKCFKKEAAHKIFLEHLSAGRDGEVEALREARRRGYKIAEIPVMWSERVLK